MEDESMPDVERGEGRRCEALLELIRQRKVAIEQTESLGDIWLCRPTTKSPSIQQDETEAGI